MADGRLYYVVGASGAGKDTLLGYARARMAAGTAAVFAHRYITRAAGAGGENHVALTYDEFHFRKSNGLFAMDWESHALRYGIGAEINYWMAAGLSVVVNGSRAYLEPALKRYPDMTVVWVSAAPELIAARLARRGRESVQEIAERMARRTLSPEQAGCRIVHISNDGPIEGAGDALLAALVGNRD